MSCRADAPWKAVQAPVNAVRPKQGETHEDALYRHGKTCMDTLERNDCAVDYFEEFLRERPRNRMAASDAMFRLLTLYERSHNTHQARALLRSFWSFGMDRGRRTALPYTTRFLPDTMTLLAYGNLPNIRSANVLHKVSLDTWTLWMSCDDDKVAAIRKRRERASDATSRRHTTPSKAGERHPPFAEPLFFQAKCALARALDETDIAQWGPVLGAQHHEDAGDAAVIVELEGANERLAAAAAHGRLVREDDHFAFADLRHGDEPLWLGVLSGNEVLVATASTYAATQRAAERRTPTLGEELTTLIERVPDDLDAFVVADSRATAFMTRTFGVIGTLLPKPAGWLGGVVFDRYAAFFFRFMTEEDLKASAFVSVARSLLANASEPSANQHPSPPPLDLKAIDIAQAQDAADVLVSLYLNATDLARLVEPPQPSTSSSS